uniref:Uncharacterized protein n=1 Tax=Sinocyclocheilus rhinocerous TaxID=307959 RepID=A0A673HN70_9TELE
MAEASISVAEDQFSCPICLDLLKDPVTIPCGHSYCMNCITDCWNQDDQKGVYSCPQCRQTFTPRPAINKNVMLAEMVGKLKTRTALSYTGPGDVECDVCTGRKYKAVRSCLMCLNSYCQSHLKQHDSFFKDKKHNLINATGRLKKMICSQHQTAGGLLSHRPAMCLLCTMNKHKNHHTVSTKAERAEKQVGKARIVIFQKRIQEREKEIQTLFELAAVEDSERIFTELIRSTERSRSEVTQMIRDREKAEVSRAEGLLEQLKQEIDDLRRRDAELKQFLHTDDHIHFLQVTDLVLSHLFIIYLMILLFIFLTAMVAKLSDCLLFCNSVICLKKFIISYYSRQLTLDPNTAHKYLRLSEGNRVATFIEADQRYPVHPDRFHDFFQVLCRESVCGRCYWEVEWSGTSGVYISVSYKSIRRKGCGFECGFGLNDQSWRLFCSKSRYSFCHNSIKTELPVVSSSCRIGVYVDHRAGILSFYSVSDTMTLIHRVQTTFTQPLYPGFRIYLGSTLKLSSP